MSGQTLYMTALALATEIASTSKDDDEVKRLLSLVQAILNLRQIIPSRSPSVAPDTQYQRA